MRPEPLVSVLLPARNAAPTLASCLRSIQRQQFWDWECIVIDDGSIDETGNLARDLSAQDPRIRVTTLPPVGLVEALNEGLARCQGTFIARMDADDVMHRARLGAQVDAMARAPHRAAVGCHVRMIPRGGLSEGRRAYEAWLNGLASEDDVRRDAFVECPVAHPALLMRREVLARFRYREMGWPEDYDLVLRLLAAGWGVGVVPRRLVAWRDGSSRLSRVDPRYSLDRFTACKAAFLASGFLAELDTFVLWGFGDTGKALARALAAHGKQPSCILEVHPGRIGQRIGGVPVAGLEALPLVRGKRILVSVAGAGPRAEIRSYLARQGFVELADFVCVA